MAQSNININALRKTFFTLFFPDYRNFLRLYIGDQNKNDYTNVLKECGQPEKSYLSINFDNNLTDEQIMNSAEEFFDIMATTTSSLEYVYKLLWFLKGRKSTEQGQWVMVEQQSFMLILTHFWQLYGTEKNLYDNNKNYSNLAAFITAYNSDKKMENVNVIQLIVNLFPESSPGRRNRLSCVGNYLTVLRKLRNKKAHEFDEFLPSDTYRAYYLARFRLYSLMATVLCLRLALKNRIASYAKPVELIVKNSTTNKPIQVSVLDLSNNEEQKVSEDGICHILRYHPYKVSVKQEHEANIEISPDWSWAAPTIVYDGAALLPYGSDIDAIAQAPGTTLSDIYHKDSEIANTLNTISDKSIEIANTLNTITGKQLNKLIDALQETSQQLFDHYATQQKYQEKHGQQMAELIDKVANLSEDTAQKRPTTESEKKLNEILAALKQSKNDDIRQAKHDETVFWLKHTPIFLALALAAVGCILHCTHIYTIYWMVWKQWYLLALILGPVLLSVWLWLIYRTTIRPKLLTCKVKAIGWGSIGLATLFWAVAIIVTPHPTAEEFLDKTPWRNPPQVVEKMLQFAEDYVVEHPASELVRSRLADYYLNYANDVEKAIEITAPMRDVKKYPNGCYYAAEALYKAGDFLSVRDIIREYNAEYKGKTYINFVRMEALMQIQGIGCTAEPDKGITKLYQLACKFDMPEIYYDLGYWTSHDLTLWNPGDTSHVLKWLRYDLTKSVRYLRKAAFKSFPKAAVELGNIFADLSMADSAARYYEMAISQTSGNLRNEALFRLGILQEQQGQADNQYLREARNNDYSPAVLHVALREKDHHTAIARLKQAGKYTGHRCIPPIVFEYLQAEEQSGSVGLRDSALALLQREHPECHFNREFIEMMEYIIGTPRVKKDLEKATQLSLASAQKGCLYAKMMWYYNVQEKLIKAGKKKYTEYFDSLSAIAPVIPFAQVLVCDLEIKLGDYYNAILHAQYPIAKGHPAAAMVLASLPNDYNFISENVSAPKQLLALADFYFIQKALRLSPYKDKWTYEAYKADKLVRKLFVGKDPYIADSTETTSFWTDVLVANHNFGAKLAVSLIYTQGDTTTTNRLVLSALSDLDEHSSEEYWDYWMFWGYGRLTEAEQLKLISHDTKMNDRARNHIMEMQDNPQKFTGYSLPTSGNLQLEIGAITLIDECSSLIEDFMRHGKRIP